MKFFSVLILFFLFYNGCDRAEKSNPVPEKKEVYRDDDVIAFFRRTTGAIAMDGGFSIPLSTGKNLWVFGDTFADNYDSSTGTVPCLFNVRNSALLQPLNNWDPDRTETLLGSGPGAKNFLKDNPDPDYFIWPSAGVQIGDTVFIACGMMKKVSGGLGFGSAGPAKWGKVSVPGMKVEGFADMPDFNGIAFGNRFIRDEKSGFVYSYGSKGAAGTFENVIYLARFPMASPESNWTYWDGNTWNEDVGRAAPLDTVPAYSWDISKFGDKYLLLYATFSLGCDQGNEIFGAVSDHLEGPFSEPKSIYTLADTVQGHYPFFYAVIAHPEYINDDKELLVTYSINGYAPCVENCVNNRFNPDYYRLRGIRVPYGLLDELIK